MMDSRLCRQPQSQLSEAPFQICARANSAIKLCTMGVVCVCACVRAEEGGKG